MNIIKYNYIFTEKRKIIIGTVTVSSFLIIVGMGLFILFVYKIKSRKAKGKVSPNQSDVSENLSKKSNMDMNEHDKVRGCEFGPCNEIDRDRLRELTVLPPISKK